MAYEYPATHLIKRMKFHGDRPATALLAELMIERLIDRLDDDFDGGLGNAILMPIPMHRQRLAERGFNQAERLSRLISRWTGLRLDTQTLSRHRATPPQVGLSRAQRKRNLKQAFRAARCPRHIILIDDVMTTGTTAVACTEVLMEAGALSVDILVAARAPDLKK